MWIFSIKLIFIIMKQFLNRRIWDKEKGVSYFCTICGQYRPEGDFYKSKKNTWGYETRCKRHFTKRDKDEDKDNSHLKFGRLDEKDFVGARKLLQQLGYNTTGDVSVHEQFKKRHKLK